MSVSKIIAIFGKILLLALLMLIVFILASVTVGLNDTPQSQPTVQTEEDTERPAPAADQSEVKVLLLLAFICLLQTTVLSYIILNSRWQGWKLALTIFTVYFGVNYILSQIESLVYLRTYLSEGMILKIVLTGLLLTAVFSPLAVWILGKWKSQPQETAPGRALTRSLTGWAWKFLIIGLVYVLIYYFFGYYLAWKNPAVQEYYGGTDPGSFFAQLKSVWQSTPWMYPFQLLRGILWSLFTLPVIFALKGSEIKVAFTVAFLFMIWSAQLLLPNPFMPEAVAQAHLIETASSNFLFGLLVGWLLRRSPHSKLLQKG